MTRMRFASNAINALARLEPIAPAPPVRRMVLCRNVSERSSISIRNPVEPPHPLDRPPNAFLWGNLGVMLQVTNRLGAVHWLGLRGKRLRVFVSDEGIVATHALQDEIRIGLDVSLPFRPARHVVDLTRDEVVEDIREGSTRVLDIVDNPSMASVDYVGLAVEGVVYEFRDEASVGRVVLTRAVAVHGADADGLRAKLLGRVQTHELSSPLRNRVVVQLPNRHLLHDVLRHGTAVVAVHFGAAEEDEVEPVTLLEPDHILRAHGICLPQVLEVVLTVPATVLSRKMEDAIEPVLLKDSFELSHLPHVATGVVVAI